MWKNQTFNRRTDFTHCSGLSIVGLEQVSQSCVYLNHINSCWVEVAIKKWSRQKECLKLSFLCKYKISKKVSIKYLRSHRSFLQLTMTFLRVLVTVPFFYGFRFHVYNASKNSESNVGPVCAYYFVLSHTILY